MLYLMKLRIIAISEEGEFSIFVLGGCYETERGRSPNLRLFCDDDPDLIDCRTR